MYQPGDFVVYADSGLCQVEQIGVPSFNKGDSMQEYYFLRVASDNSRIYVPTDTHMPLRPPMTAQEAESFLSRLPHISISLPKRRDRKTVLAHYQSLLRPHTAEVLAQAAKSIRWQHRSKPGRMSGAEESLLKRAEKQLCGELAKALGISQEDANSRLQAAFSAESDT